MNIIVEITIEPEAGLDRNDSSVRVTRFRRGGDLEVVATANEAAQMATAAAKRSREFVGLPE